MDRYVVRQAWGSFYLYDIIDTSMTFPNGTPYYIASRLLYWDAVREAFKLNESPAP